MLMKDFGFSDKEIRVFYSGHRGYHVHVEDEAVKSLDSIARKEIVDYVCGLGLDAVSYGQNQKGVMTLNVNDAGWQGRIARGMDDFVLNGHFEVCEGLGLKRYVFDALKKNRDSILKDLHESKPMTRVGVGPETWKKIIEHLAKLQSAHVDTVVTTDVHRLIRLVGTLHGKTGLKKAEFPISEIDDYDPFKSAVVFKEGTASVIVSNAPQFMLDDQMFGPFKDQKVELPTAAAVLLVCKNRAEVVG
jgi:DNA primase small subunit